MVSTLDSESSDPSSNLGGTYIFQFFSTKNKAILDTKKRTSLGGLEPPTFRLKAERANRLRHREWFVCTYTFFLQNTAEVFEKGGIAETRDRTRDL